MTSLPAVSVDAVLAGMQACGIDTIKIRALSGLAPRYLDPLELLPNSVWDSVWQHAFELDPRPELPSLVALQIPFGLFGSLDYLAGSAQTIRGGIQALADHFSAATTGTELELDFDNNDIGTLRVIQSVSGAGQMIADEFTTAVILGRFRNISTGGGHGEFRPQRVYLTRPALVNSLHEDIFGAPVIYGATRAGFDCTQEMLNIEQSLANLRLHDTLLEIAKKLGFSNNGNSSFVIAVRVRLRSLMPRGQAVAERVASSLGISERTLHRRLADEGSSFQDVIDQFRIEESERLLSQGKLKLVDIALSLGFSDQATWSRAFRRLRGMSPSAWQNSAKSVR